ncbi:hypothetical protein TEQG_08728 [Trichophyton equinum CBS 127.97]|uniref:Uncharacterized protein n=1 Tax=Trichophyton equinum (strain ATCC MYA-4606 / CBS 127.97) TaxID=559882 RepID=F2PX52_TRIEC|nr:hypothetical protein TEQG_08728 [Trichophyton equinum CBS 127.97]
MAVVIKRTSVGVAGSGWLLYSNDVSERRIPWRRRLSKTGDALSPPSPAIVGLDTRHPVSGITPKMVTILK